MRLRWPILLACVALCLATLAALTRPALSHLPASIGPRRVGFRVVDFKIPGTADVVTAAVWYPTKAPPQVYRYGGPTRGMVALDADPDLEDGPYPLLVFSHGYGGSGLGATFFTEALAARGWIVVAPDHHDGHSAVRTRGGAVEGLDRVGMMREAQDIASSGPAQRDLYAYRLVEMKTVLDGILGHAVLGHLIDEHKIAIGGHSFGGFSALGLCGPLPQYRDPRIRALLLFSTGAGSYLFREDELKAVKVPVMCMLGEAECKQKRGDQTMEELTQKIYASVSPPKYLLEIQGANHFSFNQRFSDSLAARAMSGSEEQFRVIRRYAIAFLERYILGATEDNSALSGRGAGLSRFLKDEGASAK